MNLLVDSEERGAAQVPFFGTMQVLQGRFEDSSSFFAYRLGIL